MTFEELMDMACDGLPSMARDFIPTSLSPETKALAIQLGPERFGEILKHAIEQIDRGSIKTVDELVREEMKM